MFASLTTKLAMRKVGLSSDAFDFSSKSSKPSKPSDGSLPGLDDLEESNSGWPAWMSTKKLPLTAQAWLSPVPPPVPVAECPKPGDLAPLDRDRQLTFGGGKPVIVLFLRCVGCAFAQKSFLALRDLAIKNQGRLTCIAVSHSSREATWKWVDILGGAWNVEVVIDEDRAVYAAWGLGLSNFWYMFNPTTQMQGWKEKGWLGIKVANSLQRTGSFKQDATANSTTSATTTGVGGAPEASEGPSTVMGNKWQQAGLFAVDGRGTVIWAAKALRADDLMDLNAAAVSLGF
ncbi:uncharacterized protein GGS22DRAFT_166347 [Annulohypoxylon maeteangense]|uniref:uncharacterized protein n=1 Tax=Annulohypoxylon maeteangense TaxID=1927788 RepID=UPI0020074847|nr:uncharacterized protein GGS22DRAFT_166347 [Annulohypoxylon maeteangense]KAI0883899.1 hypothetical protein GGS22DRAFT_166347 [Annulohypoxylon maeteangense]